MELSAEEKEEYRNCKIVNIHFGKDRNKNTIFAKLVDANGETMISAELDYIVANLTERLPS